MPQGLLPLSSEHPHQRFLLSQKNIGRQWLSRICSRQKAMRIFFAGVLSLCIVMYFMFSWFVVSDTFIEEMGGELSEAVVERRHDFHFTIIDRMCSPTTKVCYTVQDKKLPDEVVERHLIVDGFESESDTVVRLISPNGETFDTSDSRIWNVDHAHINSQYVAGMLVAPFLVSTLPLEGSGANTSALEIGLGGGSLDMALASLKPQMNITAVELDGTVINLAEKWFGVVSTENRRHIVGDGVKWIQEMSDTGEKVDALFLDACDSSKEDPCPAAQFRTKSLIESMKSLLKSQGVLVVNILTHNEVSGSRGIVSLFTEVFPSCLQLKVTMEINVILVCLPYTIGDSVEQLRFYSSRLRSSVSALSLQYILGDIRIFNTKP